MDIVFETLAFQVEATGETPAIVARRVIRRAFPGQRWKIVALEARKGEFEAVRLPPRGRRLAQTAPAGGWDLAYRLRDQPEVVYAEPLFTIPDAEQHVAPGAPRAVRSAADRDDPRTEGAYEWSLGRMAVPEAWALFHDGRPGRGVRIGHPDTGYTLHPEIAGARLLTGSGFDFEDGDPDALDTLDDGWLRNPGHGTGTASVIISGAGRPRGSADGPFVSGTAPFAALMPIRTTRSVVLWSMSKLVHAIRYAVDHGCHVISISLGGIARSRALHSAVQDAEAAGVIVLCAAGNQVGFVVYPAAFDEVIAVAASTIGDEMWEGSCRGPAVDITAPGASVWRAEAARANGTVEHAVKRGSGTSFAVAGTAGVAALWLSYHGRQSLIARYGKHRLASVFKQLLQSSCRKVAGWDTGLLGSGIVNAKALLNAPLPPAPPARGLRGLERRQVSIDDDPIEPIVHVLWPAQRSAVVRTIADVLKVDETALPAVLQDVGQELAFDIATDRALRERLRAASRRAPVARGVRAPAPRPDLTTARRRLARGSSRRLARVLR